MTRISTGVSRTRRGLMAAVVVALTSAGALLSSGVATAHDPSGYYTNRIWPTGTNETYFLGAGVPTVTRVQDSIRAGANQWNNRPPNVTFTDGGYNSSQQAFGFPNCSPFGTSWVFQYNIGTALAQAYSCADSQGLFKAAFVVEFDDKPGFNVWHSSTTADLPTNGAYDRWSVASHEMGHTMGHQVHWDDAASSSRCVEGISNKLTMCKTVAPETTMQRTLDDHDYHTYDMAYS